MRLHEIRNESPFALPNDRKITLFKVGMYPGGQCIIRKPDGSEIPMIGGTVVVDPEPTEGEER